MAVEHPEVVTKYIAKELNQGCIVRVSSVAKQTSEGIQISPLGAIPKKGRKGQWRLNMIFSAPQGHSVNNGINKEHCTC